MDIGTFSQSRTISSRMGDLWQSSWETEEQINTNIAHNLRKRCIKKGLKGIHDRFQKDLRYRDAQLKADRTEEKCIEMDELAQKRLHRSPIN